MSSERQSRIRGRWEPAMLAVGAILWLAVSGEIAARAATGLGSEVLGGAAVPALRGLFVAFLVAIGLQLVTWRESSGSVLRSAGLIARPSAGREWGLGVAVAWGAVTLCVLPLVLWRVLEVTLWVDGRAWLAAVLSVVGMGLGTLATEAVFRSYALVQLSKSVGRTAAVFLLVLVYGTMCGQGGLTPFLVGSGMALLFSTGWLRTHATWMPWGLHLGWNLSLGLLFGLPLLDGGDVSTVVLGQVVRRTMHSAAGLGPSGMGWTVVVLLLATAVLVAVTKDYAWRYTHPEIVPGGYPMDVAPPPAHAAMESGGAGVSAPAPLVQILPASGGTADRPGR